VNPNLEQSASPVARGANVGFNDDSCTSIVESDVGVDDVIDEVVLIPVVEEPFSAGVMLKTRMSSEITDRSLTVVDSLVVVDGGNGDGTGKVVSLTPVTLVHTTDV